MSATLRSRAPRRRPRKGKQAKHVSIREHSKLLAVSAEHGWDYLGQRGPELSFQRADPRSVLGSTKLYIQADESGFVVRAWHVGLQVPAVEGDLAHPAALDWLTEPVPTDPEEGNDD